MYLPDTQPCRQILKLAAAVLRTDQTVLGVIRENQFEDCPAGVDDPHGMCMDDHTWSADSRARWSEIPAAFDLHYADTAAARTVLNSEVIQFHVTESGNVYTHLPCSLEDCRPVFNLDLSVVYSKFNFIHLSYDY